MCFDLLHVYVFRMECETAFLPHKIKYMSELLGSKGVGGFIFQQYLSTKII